MYRCRRRFNETFTKRGSCRKASFMVDQPAVMSIYRGSSKTYIVMYRQRKFSIRQHKIKIHQLTLKLHTTSITEESAKSQRIFVIVLI